MDKIKKMNKWGKVSILSAMVIGLLLIANAAMAADTAIWTSVSISGTVAENLTLTVDEELRFDDVAGPELGRQHTDINLEWRVAELLSGIFGYRNTSAGEHRPYVGVGLSLFRGEIDIDSTTKLELRDFDTLRARTSLDFSAQVSGVTPWLTEELFVDESGVVGNRVSVGVTKGINDTFNVIAYYLLDSSGSGLSNNSHVLGVGLGVSL